jgi:hypothetical protein
MPKLGPSGAAWRIHGVAWASRRSSETNRPGRLELQRLLIGSLVRIRSARQRPGHGVLPFRACLSRSTEKPRPYPGVAIRRALQHQPPRRVVGYSDLTGAARQERIAVQGAGRQHRDRGQVRHHWHPMIILNSLRRAIGAGCRKVRSIGGDGIERPGDEPLSGVEGRFIRSNGK